MHNWNNAGSNPARGVFKGNIVMAEAKSQIVYKGIGLHTLLVIIFFILKITNTVNWHWFWVFSPWVFYFGFIVILLLFVLCLTFIVAIFGNKR